MHRAQRYQKTNKYIFPLLVFTSTSLTGNDRIWNIGMLGEARFIEPVNRGTGVPYFHEGKPACLPNNSGQMNLSPIKDNCQRRNGRGVIQCVHKK